MYTNKNISEIEKYTKFVLDSLRIEDLYKYSAKC